MTPRITRIDAKSCSVNKQQQDFNIVFLSFTINCVHGSELEQYVNKMSVLIIRARILGKMDYFYFLRHMYETCL
jgi:hypothetical protein